MSWKTSIPQESSEKAVQVFTEGVFLVRMVSYLFWVCFFFLQDLSVLTAREEEILQVQHVWGEMWARDGDSLSLKLVELSWALQIRAERGGGLGRRQEEPGRLAEVPQSAASKWGLPLVAPASQVLQLTGAVEWDCPSSGAKPTVKQSRLLLGNSSTC